MEGGTAIAEILAGEVNPSGKLTISFPHHVGQLPVCYYQPANVHGGGYPDLPAAKNFTPLFPFGFGLSYTSFRYRNLRLLANDLHAGEALTAEVEVMNTGERSGTEIAQCYLHDCYTSATWPAKLLKAYQRITLASGERATLRFTIPYDQLALIDADCRRVVEPGDFELLVGGSSRDENLLRAKFQVCDETD